MMKKLAYILAVSLSIISVSHADDTFVMDTATLKEETLNKAHQKISNYFEMMDLDKDGKLSVNECAGSNEGFENVPMFSTEELTELKKKIDSAFPRFDKNQDNYLDKEEAPAYFAYIENMAMDKQIAKMDLNGDGNISEDEVSQITQNTPSLEEQIAKFEEATQKLQNMNEDITGNAIASEEDALQMDADHDEKITKEEYTNFMFNHPNNKNLGFSKEDYESIYDLIDQDKKGYITQQQYQDYRQQELQKTVADIESADAKIIEQETQKIDEETEESNNNAENVNNDETVDNALEVQDSPLLIEETAE